MILLELIESDGTIHRLSRDTVRLTHQWRRGFVNGNAGSMGWSLPQQFGGLVRPVYGGVALSPDVLPEWPPAKKYVANLYYAKETEEDKQVLIQGILHLQRVSKGSGAEYAFYVETEEDVKIDSTAWGSINNDTLTNIITILCGADYLELAVDTAYARDSSPNVNYTFDSEQVVWELVSNLCNFYNHLIHKKNNILYLVSMFTENGSTIDLKRNITNSDIVEFSPVSRISVTAGDDWEIVATTNPYGNPINITPYHNTESNALVELEFAKAIIDSDSAKVTLPLAKLPSLPNPGQPVHWIDDSYGQGIEATIKARDIRYDFTDETITITGEGSIGSFAKEGSIFYIADYGEQVMDTSPSTIPDTTGDIITDTQ